MNPAQLKTTLTALCLGAALSSSLKADTVLETETAQLGKKGDWLISNSVQFEKDRDGNRRAFTLMQFEYAVTDRAEILIEPFFQEWNKAKGERTTSGIGDLEITPSYMIVTDNPKSWMPAILLAFKLKVPMARNRDIGSGRVDYYPYVIIGKQIGNWILNANLGVNFIGRGPDDHDTRDQFVYDFSIERIITPRWSIFAECFGNSSPAVGEKQTFSGALATEFKFTEHFNAFVSVGYDTNHLFNVRPGFNVEY